MEKDKRPRKPRKPARDKKAAPTPAAERPARAKAGLVPVARRPPQAAGAHVPERQRPAVDRLLRLLRTAVGALLDVADAAAGAITRARNGRG
jgi:hypothetical protein